MTISRHPTGQDLACAHCHTPNDLDIDHIRNRGAGGSKERDVAENKIALCRQCHRAKTVGVVKTWVKDGVYHWRKADSDLVFRVPVQVSKRYGCLIPTEVNDGLREDDLGSTKEVSSLPTAENNQDVLAGQETGPVPGMRPATERSARIQSTVTTGAGDGSQSGERLAESPLPVAGEGEGADRQGSMPQCVIPTPSLVNGPGLIPDGGARGPLMDGEEEQVAQPSTATGSGAGFPAVFSSPSSLCQEGMQLLYWGLRIKGATDDWRWAVGDLILRMEEVYNESAYQFLEPLKEAFGYDALRQYRMVAAGVTRVTRIPELSWSHHRAVATLPEDDQRLTLFKARMEGLSSRETVALVRPEPAERERHDCPLCGFSHSVIVKGEWRA